MATFGHLAIGAAAARLGLPASASRRRVVVTTLGLAALASAPDLDVIAFSLGIPYAHPWGHRGAAHSPVVALLAAAVIFGVGRWVGRWPWRLGVAVAVTLVSHGLLDALTNGGLGIALLWPFSDARFFAPWQPLRVAPIGLGMLSARGVEILVTEAVLFSPFVAIALWPRRRRGAADQSAKEDEEPDEPEGDRDDSDGDAPEAVSIPIDGTLDLHDFAPRDVGDLVDAYLEECRAEGILEVRIVHGKGIGNLRRTVHARLERSPHVASFGLAGGDGGSWGATLVTLRPTDPEAAPGDTPG